jgi:hypothetical protein
MTQARLRQAEAASDGIVVANGGWEMVRIERLLAGGLVLVSVLFAPSVGCLRAQEHDAKLAPNCTGNFKVIDGHCQYPADDPEAVCLRQNLKHAKRVDGYVFRTFGSDDGSCLTVIRNRKVIFRRTVAGGPDAYTLGQELSTEWKSPGIPDGTDITGRGHPDMIVGLYSGGAHCCMFHYVFELEPKFMMLAMLDSEDDDLAHFERLGPDRKYYYMTADWTFAYWPGSFASSPSHSVVLRFVDDDKGGRYHLALDKMQRPAPTAVEWRDRLSDVKGAVSDGADPDAVAVTLWGTVLDLIYTGHSDLAWKFSDEADPAAQKDPLPDLGSFCSILKSSPYWPDLEGTIKNMPPACANAKASWGER